MHRILVCNHKAVTARQVSRHLSRAGYEVVGTASTGRDAVAKTEEYHPDLIMMDITMPGEINGIEASRIIGEKFDIPIIFTGARADENQITRAKALRPAGYLFAPFKEIEITAAVGAAISTHKTERQLGESDQVYRMVVENAMESITIIQDNRIVYVNPRALEMGGYTQAEMISRPFYDFLVPEDQDAAIEEYERGLSAGTQAQPTFLRAMAKDGTIRWMEIRSVPVSWEAKPAVLSFAVDVTERREVEETLLRNEKRYRVITENMRDTVWVLDMSFKTMFISPSVERARGYTFEELKAFPLERHITPESLDEAVRSILSALSRKTEGIEKVELPQTLTLEFIRKDGTTYWSEVAITVINDEAGRPAEILGVGRDITERKAIEESLRTLRKAVESSALGITVSDLSGKIIYTNPAEAKMHGCTVEELLGRPAWTLAPETLRERMTPEQIDAMQGKTQETLNVRGDGTPFPVNRTSDVVRTETGRPLYIVSICEDITERRQIEAERERLIAELREALVKVKTLSGLLPICASCKRIRDDKGNWSPIEVYIHDRSDAQFSHGICPDCARRLYPRFYEDDNK